MSLSSYNSDELSGCEDRVRSNDIYNRDREGADKPAGMRAIAWVKIMICWLEWPGNDWTNQLRLLSMSSHQSTQQQTNKHKTTKNTGKKSKWMNISGYVESAQAFLFSKLSIRWDLYYNSFTCYECKRTTKKWKWTEQELRKWTYILNSLSFER